MNVTPIHPLVFMLSKALPYIVISIFMVCLAHPIVGLLYGLWPQGNVGMMIVGTCLLYTSLFASDGTLVATTQTNMPETTLSVAELPAGRYVAPVSYTHLDVYKRQP